MSIFRGPRSSFNSPFSSVSSCSMPYSSIVSFTTCFLGFFVDFFLAGFVSESSLSNKSPTCLFYFTAYFTTDFQRTTCFLDSFLSPSSFESFSSSMPLLSFSIFQSTPSDSLSSASSSSSFSYYFYFFFYLASTFLTQLLSVFMAFLTPFFSFIDFELTLPLFLPFLLDLFSVESTYAFMLFQLSSSLDSVSFSQNSPSSSSPILISFTFSFTSPWLVSTVFSLSSILDLSLFFYFYYYLVILSSSLSSSILA